MLDMSKKILTLRERLRGMNLLGETVAVCGGFGVSLEEAAGRSLQRPVKDARHAVWRLLLEHGWSGPYIARLFGVHHTTVYYALGMLNKKGTAPRPAEGGVTAEGHRTGKVYNASPCPEDSPK